ncbi:Dyp-type peroxidase [Rhizoctonia solani AG-3 Rhs1AP]|uniref:Dyp-type peroxidase n=1 Tax=Rhizoctonia solani AG-3 Rhs1AP TaxID=1086054 RepID=A0A0A1UHZ1_9AGAM|nr:Dyp-type peroxidase [Rhizoctonia solani AG-3 Rhs1AP]
MEDQDLIAFTQHLIGFSKAGLKKLVGDEKTGDNKFDEHCMLQDKARLGDQSQWELPFASGENGAEVSTEIDGVISIASSSIDGCNTSSKCMKKLFGDCCETTVKSADSTSGGSGKSKDEGWTWMVEGNVRPGENRGHEHFGFLDGISQPSIRDIEHPLPGQAVVDAGVIVMGYPGDPVPKSKRPGWAIGGTMMVLRKLQQDVIAFDDYCEANGKNGVDDSQLEKFIPGGKETVTELKKRIEQDIKLNKLAVDLFAARFVGRWKSGAPLPLAPFKDNPELGADPKRNNDFEYSLRGGADGASANDPSEYYCPFAAHTRKMAARNLGPFVSRQYLDASVIVRSGIPYGPEEKAKADGVQAAGEEPTDYVPENDRGLLFVCYSSDLNSGFVRQTTGFGNNDFFPITSLNPTKHGQDPIIGGPPAPKSPQVPMEVEPKTIGTNGQVGIQPTTPYTVSKDQQVNYRVKVGKGETEKEFEVSGFAREVPKNPPFDADNPFFVTSRGGEYFFVPSIPTLEAWASSATA